MVQVIPGPQLTVGDSRLITYLSKKIGNYTERTLRATDEILNTVNNLVWLI